MLLRVRVAPPSIHEKELLRPLLTSRAYERCRE